MKPSSLQTSSSILYGAKNLLTSTSSRHKANRATHYKPSGQSTRGKTNQNRLRRADNFLLTYDPHLIRRQDGPFAKALFVDLGYGANPTTTLESVHRFHKFNSRLPVLGVEIDPERVAEALPYQNQYLSFRLGGFNLPLQTDETGELETVRLLRAFNVLRQYEEAAVVEAYQQMGRGMLVGGLLLEGTSTPFGRLWVANVVRRTPQETWQPEALVFSTNFRTGFDPAEFQTILPKNFIHRVVPGEVIYDFFQAWKRAAVDTRPMAVWGLRQWFIAAAEKLAGQGYRINVRRKWLAKGYLIWRQG